MTRYYLFLLSLILSIGNVFADTNHHNDDWYFKITGTAPDEYIIITSAINITNKTELVFPEYIDVDGVSYPVKGIQGDVYTVSGGTTSYSSFKNRTNLVKVTFPSTLTTIGKELFYGCTGLTEINIPENVTNMGDNAFANTKIATLHWNAINCKTYNNEASNTNTSHPFLNCPITSVTIGDKVTVIPKYFLSNYRNTYKIEKLVIPENITDLGASCFCSCQIGELQYNATEADCENGTGFPAYHTFGGNITKLSIGKNVKSLQSGLFYGVKQIRFIYAPAIPPVCPDNTVFQAVDKVNCEVYVPESSIPDYKLSVQWKEFTFKADKNYVDNTAQLLDVTIIDKRSNSNSTVKIPEGTAVNINLGDYNGLTHSITVNGKVYFGDAANNRSIEITEPTTIEIDGTFIGIVDSPTITATEYPVNLHTPIFLSSMWYKDGSGTIYYTKDGSEPEPNKATVDPALVNGHADFNRAAGNTDPSVDQGTFIYTGPFYMSLGGWFSGGKLSSATIKSTVIRHKDSPVEMVGTPSSQTFTNLTTGVAGIPAAVNTANVKGLTGEVEILDYDGPVTVYDISGRIVSSGITNDGYLKLNTPAGTTFVRCGDSISKVLVK